jgi:hypothetical protein
MTSQRGSTGGQDPMRAGSQLFEAGYQQLFEGWKQAQEFWNGMARTWGGAAGAWMQQGAGSNESMEVLRELNESALAVAQAWMRMPMAMMGGANPTELQEAITRLTQAQGRAYQLWLEALRRSGSSAAGTARQAAKEMEKK